MTANMSISYECNGLGQGGLSKYMFTVVCKGCVFTFTTASSIKPPA